MFKMHDTPKDYNLKANIKFNELFATTKFPLDLQQIIEPRRCLTDLKQYETNLDTSWWDPLYYYDE